MGPPVAGGIHHGTTGEGRQHPAVGDAVTAVFIGDKGGDGTVVRLTETVVHLLIVMLRHTGIGRGRRTHQRSRHQQILLCQIFQRNKAHRTSFEHQFQNLLSTLGQTASAAAQKPAAQQHLLSVFSRQFKHESSSFAIWHKTSRGSTAGKPVACSAARLCSSV